MQKQISVAGANCGPSRAQCCFTKLLLEMERLVNFIQSACNYSETKMFIFSLCRIELQRYAALYHLNSITARKLFHQCASTASFKPDD